MTTRDMYDATNLNVAALKNAHPNPAMIAWYGTGSPDIAWTPGDLALFPNALKVEIDQGFTGSPVLTAIVRDIELGAWTVSNAVNRTGWNVPRPTQYCDRNTIPSLLSAGWKGDIWLAWPGWTPTVSLPSTPGCNIVAVQDQFDSLWDHSTVLDPTWPNLPGIPAPIQQNNWKWCRKCQGLNYDPNVLHSVCPAGGMHDNSRSGNYSLTDNP